MTSFEALTHAEESGPPVPCSQRKKAKNLAPVLEAKVYLQVNKSVLKFSKRTNILCWDLIKVCHARSDQKTFPSVQTTISNPQPTT